MLAPDSMAITALSIILLFSGDKKRLVTKPDAGSSTSPQSAFFILQIFPAFQQA